MGRLELSETAARFRKGSERSGSVYNGLGIGGVVFAGGFAGDSVTQPDAATVQFDASTDGADIQSISLDSASEPVSFDLYIDGYAAVSAVIFSSGGVDSTSDVMPFDLTTASSVRASRSVPPFPASRSLSSASAGKPVFIPAPARITRSAAIK